MPFPPLFVLKPFFLSPHYLFENSTNTETSCTVTPWKLLSVCRTISSGCWWTPVGSPITEICPADLFTDPSCLPYHSHSTSVVGKALSKTPGDRLPSCILCNISKLELEVDIKLKKRKRHFLSLLCESTDLTLSLAGQLRVVLISKFSETSITSFRGMANDQSPMCPRLFYPP